MRGCSLSSFSQEQLFRSHHAWYIFTTWVSKKYAGDPNLFGAGWLITILGVQAYKIIYPSQRDDGAVTLSFDSPFISLPFFCGVVTYLPFRGCDLGTSCVLGYLLSRHASEKYPKETAKDYSLGWLLCSVTFFAYKYLYLGQTHNLWNIVFSISL